MILIGPGVFRDHFIPQGTIVLEHPNLNRGFLVTPNCHDPRLPQEAWLPMNARELAIVEGLLIGRNSWSQHNHWPSRV